MTEKENHLPNLSSEERAHALELAMQARRRYAALKARMKSGELTFTDAMDEKDAKRILVASLLQSVPGIGASKTEFIMRLYRIPKSRRVGGLGNRQREALVALEKNGWKLGLLEQRNWEHGIEPVATIGGTEAVSKRVRCIETGKEYRSIQDAADDVQRSRASLSSAIKRSGTCAGCHWALV